MVYQYEALELSSLGKAKSKIIRLATRNILYTFGLICVRIKV